MMPTRSGSTPLPEQPTACRHLLASYPAEEMTAHPVSTLVNSPANDRAECVVPVNDL